MDNFARRGVTYQSLNNEVNRIGMSENPNAVPAIITLDQEHEDTTNVIIHKVPKNKGNILFLIIPLFFHTYLCCVLATQQFTTWVNNFNNTFRMLFFTIIIFVVLLLLSVQVFTKTNFDKCYIMLH